MAVSVCNYANYLSGELKLQWQNSASVATSNSETENDDNDEQKKYLI